MANSWENRVRFIIRTMYDIDGNGVLDKNDFQALALKNTLIQGKGNMDLSLLDKNNKIMNDLWSEISSLADFNKDGEVSVDEFQTAMANTCKGKSYDELPEAFKFFINASFEAIDVDADGSIGLNEYRLSCVNRQAFQSIEEIDQAFELLLEDEDGKKGGLTLTRYQDLYSRFIGNESQDQKANFLFGPLRIY